MSDLRPMNEPQAADPFDLPEDVWTDGETFDPATVIRIRSADQTYNVPVPESGMMTIGQAVEAAGLTVTTSIQYLISGINRDASFEIGAGTLVHLVGRVKGGN